MEDREALMTLRLVVSAGQSRLSVVPIDRERITIGRRPYNDLPLDDLTVSGEHAVIETRGGESVIRDLGSRNGTIVNGIPVRRQPLRAGDLIEIGIYRLRCVAERAGHDAGAEAPGSVEFLNGPYAGAVQPLDRPICRVGNSGDQVAVISRRKGGYHITHLEGLTFPQVNGELIGLNAHPLIDGDLIELAGTMLRFRQPG